MHHSRRFSLIFSLILLLGGAGIFFFAFLPAWRQASQPQAAPASIPATLPVSQTPLAHGTPGTHPTPQASRTATRVATAQPGPSSAASQAIPGIFNPTWQIPAGVIAGILAILVFLFGPNRLRPTKAHGSAHWATLGELWHDHLVFLPWQEQRARRRALAHGERPPSFFPLGRSKGVRLALSERQQESHVGIIAPTGKGKTTTMMIPPLLQEQGHRSLFINDSKGELALTTWGALAEHHTCYHFAPTKPTRSHCYNPLAHVHTMTDAEDLATCMLINTGKSTDPFWDNAAGLLLTGVIWHLRKTRPDAPFSSLIDLLCGTPAEEVKAVLMSSPSQLVQKVSASFISAVSKNERLEGAVFTELASRLFRMHNPSVVAVTSQNEIDFTRLIAEPSALFLHIPQGDVERLKWLSATLVMQLMRTLIQSAQERPTLRLARPFAFYLDEFCNAGRIPHFEEHISLVRSAGIAYILAVQDFGQLEREYGEQGMKTIMSNITHKVFFPGCGLPESSYASELAGDATVITYSESDRPDPSSSSFFSPGSRSLTSSETRRRLLTPDEIRRLPKGTALLFSDTTPPIRLKTKSYLEDRPLLERSRLPLTLPQGPTIQEEEDMTTTLMQSTLAQVTLLPVLPVPDEE